MRTHTKWAKESVNAALRLFFVASRTSFFFTGMLSFSFRLAEALRDEARSYQCASAQGTQEFFFPGHLWPVAAHHHGLPCCQLGHQHVLLHDVAGHSPESLDVPQLTVDQDVALHARLPMLQ